MTHMWFQTWSVCDSRAWEYWELPQTPSPCTSAGTLGEREGGKERTKERKNRKVVYVKKERQLKVKIPSNTNWHNYTSLVILPWCQFAKDFVSMCGLYFSISDSSFVDITGMQQKSCWQFSLDCTTLLRIPSTKKMQYMHRKIVGTDFSYDRFQKCFI